MEITQKTQENVTVLALNGNIVGASESGILIDTLHELLEKGQTRVVIDLTQVSWMNSSGLGTLISGLNTMRQAGGNLKLCGMSPKIKNLLTITKLVTVFESFPAEADAVKSYQD